MADDPADHKEHVIGGVSFTGDDVVALEPDGTALKRRESTFQELLIAERFGEIHRRANSALSLWRYKWRAAEFNDAHRCCPLNVRLPQPVPPAVVDSGQIKCLCLRLRIAKGLGLKPIFFRLRAILLTCRQSRCADFVLPEKL